MNKRISAVVTMQGFLVLLLTARSGCQEEATAPTVASTAEAMDSGSTVSAGTGPTYAATVAGRGPTYAATVAGTGPTYAASVAGTQPSGAAATGTTSTAATPASAPESEQTTISTEAPAKSQTEGPTRTSPTAATVPNAEQVFTTGTFQLDETKGTSEATETATNATTQSRMSCYQCSGADCNRVRAEAEAHVVCSDSQTACTMVYDRSMTQTTRGCDEDACPDSTTALIVENSCHFCCPGDKCNRENVVDRCVELLDASGLVTVRDLEPGATQSVEQTTSPGFSLAEDLTTKDSLDATTVQENQSQGGAAARSAFTTEADDTPVPDVAGISTTESMAEATANGVDVIAQDLQTGTGASDVIPGDIYATATTKTQTDAVRDHMDIQYDVITTPGHVVVLEGASTEGSRQNEPEGATPRQAEGAKGEPDGKVELSATVSAVGRDPSPESPGSAAMLHPHLIATLLASSLLIVWEFHQ